MGEMCDNNNMDFCLSVSFGLTVIEMIKLPARLSTSECGPNVAQPFFTTKAIVCYVPILYTQWINININ